MDDVPCEARNLEQTKRRFKLIYAVGSQGRSGAVLGGLIGGVVLFFFCVCVGTAARMGVLGLVVGVAVGLLTGSLGFIAHGDKVDRDIQTELARIKTYPFPITGYEYWLIAEQPEMLLELKQPADETRVARMVRSVDDHSSVDKLTETRFRIITPSKLLGTSSGEYHHIEVWGGDRQIAGAFFDRVCVPLHNDACVVKVQMGGRMGRRGGAAR